MKRLFACLTAFTAILSGCTNGEGSSSLSSLEVVSNSALQIRIETDNESIVFSLNDSTASRSLYEQLPLTLSVENFGNNEKIFYPPEKLDVSDTPLADGAVGTLAYYEPWGDVVMFYGKFNSSNSLFELGTAIEGAEQIELLSGEIRVVKADDLPKNQTDSSATTSEGTTATEVTVEPTSDVTTSSTTTVGEVLSSSVTSLPTDEVLTEVITTQETVVDRDMLRLEIIINEEVFTATLYDSETAREFAQMLPMTLDMRELNGNEKFCYLESSLTRSASVPNRINSGDLMLYGSDCLVLFYESFSTSYSYTPLGKLDSSDGLADTLGKGNVTMTFQIK